MRPVDIRDGEVPDLDDSQSGTTMNNDHLRVYQLGWHAMDSLELLRRHDDDVYITAVGLCL